MQGDAPALSLSEQNWPGGPFQVERSAQRADSARRNTGRAGVEHSAQ